MASTRPARSVDGKFRLTVRVEHRLTRSQLLGIVAHHIDTADDPEAYAKLSAARIRADVVEQLRWRGADMFVDGMDIADWDTAMAMAERLVARVFPGFPEDAPRFEWPPPDRPTLDELPPLVDDELAAAGALLTPPEEPSDV